MVTIYINRFSHTHPLTPPPPQTKKSPKARLLWAFSVKSRRRFLLVLFPPFKSEKEEKSRRTEWKMVVGNCSTIFHGFLLAILGGRGDGGWEGKLFTRPAPTSGVDSFAIRSGTKKRMESEATYEDACVCVRMCVNEGFPFTWSEEH